MLELESLLGFFASFVLEKELVQQMMRWDVTVLRESPWYQEIFLEGENKGCQQGKQVGVLREQSLSLHQLTRRIGKIAPALRSQIQALSLTQIEELGEALLDFSNPADLDDWLRSCL